MKARSAREQARRAVAEAQRAVVEARPGPLIRVLVVDDSAVVRQTLSRLLSDAGGFEVSVAATRSSA